MGVGLQRAPQAAVQILCFLGHPLPSLVPFLLSTPSRLASALFRCSAQLRQCAREIEGKAPAPSISQLPRKFHPSLWFLACPWPVLPDSDLPRLVAKLCSLLQVSAETLFGNVPSLIRVHKRFWEEVLGPTLGEARASGQPLDPVSLQDGFLTVRHGEGPRVAGAGLGKPREILSAGSACATQTLLGVGGV